MKSFWTYRGKCLGQPETRGLKLTFITTQVFRINLRSFAAQISYYSVISNRSLVIILTADALGVENVAPDPVLLVLGGDAAVAQVVLALGHVQGGVATGEEELTLKHRINSGVSDGFYT